MSDHSTAALVVIGNEILSGKVVDANSPLLARELRALGVSLERIVVIPDEIDEIAAAVRDCSDRYHVVFTSGGVGPTHDDITMDGVARAFEQKVVEHDGLIDLMARHVGRELTPAHRKMAMVPEDTELVPGDGNVAFPTIRVRNVYVLPGIPQLFEAKVQSLRPELQQSPYHLRQVLVSEGETEIADFLHATLAEFPELLLGSYPTITNPDYRVRLTLESKDEGYVESALEDLLRRMPDGFVVGLDDPPE